MKNMFWVRGAVLMIILSIFITDSKAQYLDVPLIAQENTEWCWAASLEMVISFHGKPLPANGQCGFAQDLVELIHNTNYYSAPSAHPTNSCNSTCGTGNPSNKYNQRIEFSRRGRKVDYQYTDMIFARHGFFSIEDIHTDLMDFTAIKAELDACQPFLVFLNKVEEPSRPYSHVVVAKGYYETLNDKYILVNDPLPVCDGCEALIPIRVFNETPDLLNGALQVVRSIAPRDQDQCEPCLGKPTVTTTDLISAVENNVPLFNNLGNNTISQASLSGLLASTSGTGTPDFSAVSYIYTYWTTVGGWNVNTVDVQLLIANTTSPRLAFYLQEDAGSWIIKSITLADCVPLDPIASYKFIIAEQENIQINVAGKELAIMEFMPDFQQYYKLNYKGKSYLSPVRNYGGIEFEEGVMYPEKEVKKYLGDKQKDALKSELGNIGYWKFKCTEKRFFKAQK